MTESPVANGQPAARRRSALPRIGALHWSGAFDAMAPYLIVIIAAAIARHPFASLFPARVAIVVAIILLASGTGATFFWVRSDAHLTWPVALILLVLLTPLLALHVSLESRALNAPAPINLLPLVFTWTGQLVVSLLIAGYLYATCANHPGWAGITVAPLAILISSVPTISLDVSQHALLTALLYVYTLAEVAAGVGWLLPERYRWFLIPATLATGGLTVARIVQTTSHHLPGRWLLLGDAVLASLIGLIALGSPLLCRWLAAARK